MSDTVFPGIVPTGYTGDYQDFIVRAKADRSGAMRVVTGSVAVAAATTKGNTIGLAPFTKGAKLVTGGSQIYTTLLDTTATLSFGYLYSDSSSAGANAASNTSAYSSSDSHSQLTAGGLITIGATSAGTSLTTNVCAQNIDLAGDGWFALTVNTTVTATAGAVNYTLCVAYDQSGVQN